MDIAIIGAGASGMMAAITASEREENRITVFEKSDRVGRKILASGNGRCNFTNANCSEAYYHGSGIALFNEINAHFNNQDTVKWFRSKGLISKEERFGRLYPFSERASSILDILRSNLERKNIILKINTGIRKIAFENERFIISDGSKEYEFHKLIIATGGIASPKLGGTADGYRILESFGHSIVEPGAALTRIRTNNSITKQLNGVRTEATVFMFDGLMNKITEQTGEVQFTNDGLSGPAIFDLARYVSTNKGERSWKNKCILVDLVPIMSEQELKEYLTEKQKLYARDDLRKLFVGLLHNQIGITIIKTAGLDVNRAMSSLNDVELKRIVYYTKNMRFDVIDKTDLKDAQVTSGGVLASEIDCTLQSKIIPNLYVCGEVIDLDGNCGGYNLQWAWASGHTAGCYAGEIIK